MQQVKRALKTIAGVGLVLVGAFAALCTAMSVGDIVNGVEVGTAVGLMIFFGTVTAVSGWSGLRLLTGRSGHERATTTTTAATTTTTAGIDIALEAQVLRTAAQQQGRVTPIEVAAACAVSIETATNALEQLVMRGHAELAVADDGTALYVLRGFLTVEEKQEAELVIR